MQRITEEGRRRNKEKRDSGLKSREELAYEEEGYEHPTRAANYIPAENVLRTRRSTGTHGARTGRSKIRSSSRVIPISDYRSEPVTEGIRYRRDKRTSNRILFFVCVGLICGLAVLLIGSMIVRFVNDKYTDYKYGYPRTWQADAVVGHGDSPSNPSHFIIINKDGVPVIIEFAGGDPAKTRVVRGPQTLNDKCPYELGFKDANGDGKLDMIVLDQCGGFSVIINDGSKFDVNIKYNP
jgi:hypothetical protein